VGRVGCLRTTIEIVVAKEGAGRKEEGDEDRRQHQSRRTRTGRTRTGRNKDEEETGKNGGGVVDRRLQMVVEVDTRTHAHKNTTATRRRRKRRKTKETKGEEDWNGENREWRLVAADDLQLLERWKKKEGGGVMLCIEAGGGKGW
jgi:hypothetical protein